MSKKCNLKSVRLSDEIMDYVVNFSGEGFNQKFENLVKFCMQDEERIRRTLNNYQDRMESMLHQFTLVEQLQKELNYLSLEIQGFQGKLKTLSSLIDNLNDDDFLPFL